MISNDKLFWALILTLLVFLSAGCTAALNAKPKRTGQRSQATMHTSILDAADPATGIIWKADFETGDLSQIDNGGLITISGRGNAEVTDTMAHSGKYSAALTIHTLPRGAKHDSGVRLAWTASRWVAKEDPKNLPDEAYYSAYYYIPQTVVTDWWNLMQWKRSAIQNGSQTRLLTFSLSGAYAEGNVYLTLRSRVNAEGKFVEPGQMMATASRPLPIGSWFQLECYYRWAQTPTGQVTCWQDGELLWDVTNVITEHHTEYNSYPRQWTANNYSGNTDPAEFTIYLDDLTISTKRIGR